MALWFAAGLLVAACWWTWRAVRVGRQIQKAEQDEAQLDRIHQTKRARSKPDCVPDPGKQLRDDWRR